MITRSTLYKVIAAALCIALTLSLTPPPALALLFGVGVAHAASAKNGSLSVLMGETNSPMAQALQESLPPELSQQFNGLGALGPDGEPNGLLMDIGAMQATAQNEPDSLAAPISISRVQSAYRAAGVISGTLVITFTVTNNQAPVIALPQLPPSATITDTLNAVAAIDFSNDPNVIHNVLVADSLTNNATFVASSPMPDRSGSQYAWNLGDVPPLGSITATLKISVPTSIADFIDLDTGATAWGTLQGRAVSASTAPATLAPETIGGEPIGDWLMWTVDADYYDEYMVAKAAELGNDWAQMFAYVRSLGYESYKGSLRGTRGTLWSEAGNSLDQASLLIAMLRGSGVPARYRHGALITTTAQSLILSMFPEPTSVIGHIPPGADLADPANDPQLLEETIDHWWVEAYIPGLGWTNLDPTFANAAPGQTFYASLAADGTDRIAEVPDNLRHKVTVTIKVEQYHPLNVGNSGLSYAYPLMHVFNTVELVGNPVTLGHLVNTNAQTGMVFFWVRHTYIPYFRGGGIETLLEGHPFQDMISNFPFGTFLTTGEWLILETRDADGRVETYIREVFDRIGFEVRQTGGTVNAGESTGAEPAINRYDLFTILISTSEIPSTAVLKFKSAAQRKLDHLNIDPAELETLAQITNPTSEQMAKIRQGQQAVQEMSTMLNSALDLAFGNYADTSDSILASGLMVLAYADSSNILIASSQVESSDAETIKTNLNLDLQRMAKRSVTSPGQVTQADSGYRMLAGYFYSWLEGSLLSLATGGQVISTFAISAEASRQGVPMIALTSDTLDKLAALDLSVEAKARITADLGAGYIVIVPERMITIGESTTVGWWRIDPETGRMTDMMENGLHQAMVEQSYLSIFIKLLGTGIVLGFLYQVFVCFAAKFIANVLGVPFEDVKKLMDLFGASADVLLIFEGIKALLSRGGFVPTTLEIWAVFIPIALGFVIGAFAAYKLGLDPPLPITLVSNGSARPVANKTQIAVTVTRDYIGPAITVQASTNSIAISDTLQAFWNIVGITTTLAYTTLRNSVTYIYDASGGVPLAAGSIVCYTQTSLSTALANGSIIYSLIGQENASLYASALPGLGAGTHWLTYTAQLSSTQPYTLELRDVSVTVNGTDVYTGDFTLVTTSTTTITGSGHTAAPNFAPSLSGQAQDARLMIGPATGAFLVGGQPVDASNGLAIAGYTGPITVTEATTTTDHVELVGDASFFTLAVSPTASVVDPNTPTYFRTLISSNFTDTFTVTVEAPKGWEVAIDASGLISATPPLGAEPGDYAILVTAQSSTYPDLFASAVHTVSTISYQGMALDVAEDPLITVPWGPADPNALPGDTNNSRVQLPGAAYTIDITNTSTTSHTFSISISGPYLPSDWLVLSGAEGQTTITLSLPAGDVGQIGLYISPTVTALPLAGTEYTFTVTATAVDYPVLTQSDADVFTVPAVTFNQVMADPQLVYVAPDAAATFNLSVRNIGNTTGDFPIAVTLPVTTWSVVYSASTGLLGAGLANVQVVTFTTTGSAAGDNKVIRIASPAPGTAYTQTTFVHVAVRAPEVVCAFEAALAAPADDPGLASAVDNLRTQLELWTNLADLEQRDRAATAMEQVVAQLEDYSGLAVTAQLAALAAQIRAHTEPGDLAADRGVLGDLLCQDLGPALGLLSSYNPSLIAWPSVLATVPGRTVTSTLTAINNGDAPATAQFALSGVPVGWSVPTPAPASLQPGVAQQVPLVITPDALGTQVFSVSLRLAEAPSLVVTRTVSVRVVSELLAITQVTLNPDFLNIGTGSASVSIRLANPSGMRAATTADVRLTDATGAVRQSLAVPFNVAVNNSGPFSLGSLDIDGLEQGIYTATVRLLDLNGTLIPNAIGYTHLTIGQSLKITYDFSPCLVAPGGVATVTTMITTERTDAITSTAPFTFTPVLKWEKSSFSTASSYNQVVNMPAVADINLDGIPDVIFATYTGLNYASDGILRVLSGDDGSELFSVTNSSYRVMPSASPAVVDLDNDGSPEIIIERDAGGLYAFDNQGNLKYTSSAFVNPQYGTIPAVADLNQDGWPEIVVGRYVLNHDFSQVTTLGSGGGDGNLVMSVVGDVNLDGSLEVVAANTVYTGTGGIQAQNPALPSFASDGLGNFDSDPYAEIVLVDPYNGGRVYLLDHMMNIVWGPVAVPRSIGGGIQMGNGGPPTIADFDGDELPEIGVAGDSSYVVFDTDGSVLWQSSTKDYSSGFTGSSVFDFQGDGRAEAIYADENNVRVYDGANGSILFSQAHASITGYELPVITDVDADGHAEIVVVANNSWCPQIGCGGDYTGVRVFEAVDDSWVSTRQLWHQHAYDVVSVDDDLRVVADPTPNWLVYNNFRCQAPTPRQGNSYFVDIRHSLSLLGTVLLTDTISPVPVSQTDEQIYWRYDQQDREQFKESHLSQRLEPPLQAGETRRISNGTTVTYTLNDNATRLSLPPLYVEAPHIVNVVPAQVVAAPGETVQYTIILTNAFETEQTFNLTVLGVPGAQVMVTSPVTLAAGAAAQVPLTMIVPKDAEAQDWMLLVRALPVSGGEDVASAELSVRPGPRLTISPPLQFTTHGELVTYTLSLTNTTIRAEQYGFTTQGLAGLPVSMPGPVTLAVGESVTRAMVVTAQALQGTLPFTVQANGSTGLSASSEAGLGVLNGPGVRARLSPVTAIAGRGAPALYTLTVTNVGSIEDSYSFALNLPSGWSYALTANGQNVSTLSLTPYVFNAANLQLLVTPPAGELPATYPVTVVVASQSDPNVIGMANGFAQVVSQGVQVTIDPESVTMDPTDSRTWNVTVTNTGEAADTFELMAGGIVSSTAEFSPNPVSLAAGASTLVQLSAGELDFALPQTYPFAVTARSQSNPAVQNYDTADITFTGFQAVEVGVVPISQTLTNTLQASYLLLITNTGNVDTVFTLNVNAAPSLELVLEVNELYLPPHMMAGILLTARANMAGTYLITVSAASTTSAAQDEGTATLIVIPGGVLQANLDILKQDGPDPVLTGATLTYTLLYGNAGVLGAQEVYITDTLPVELSFGGIVGTNPPLPDPIQNGQQLSWHLSALPSSVEGVIVFTATVNAGISGTITNTVFITSSTPDSNLTDNYAAASTVVTTTLPPPTTNLSVTKSDSPDPVQAGSTLTYTLLYTNAGPTDAQHVWLLDTLPDGVSFEGVVSINPPLFGPTLTGQLLAWYTPTLPMGEAGTLVFTVTVATSVSGTITNTTTITTTTPDDNLANNSDAEPTVVTPTVGPLTADLSIAKLDSPDPVQAGAVLTYTLLYTNAGPADAYTTILTDVLPVQLSFGGVVSTQPPLAAPVQNGQTLVWQLQTLAIQAWGRIILTTTVEPGFEGTLTNTVAISSATPDDNPTNNSDAEPTVVTPITIVPAAITGTVFEDANGNQTRDPGEAGLGSVQLSLDQALTTTTTLSGVFALSTTLPGRHTLIQTDLPGYTSTTPNSVVITVTLGGSYLVNFGDRLIAPIPCFSDTHEQDDSPAAAHSLGLGISATLNFCDDATDWLTFTAQANEVYTITTLAWGQRADTILALYDTDGSTLLAINDDYAGAPHFSSRLVWLAAANGIYFVRVSNRGDLTGDLTGYDVRIDSTTGPSPMLLFLPLVCKTSTPSAATPWQPNTILSPLGVITHTLPDPYEVDDIWQQAQPIIAGEVQTHTFDSPTASYAPDKDYVHFALAPFSLLTFTVLSHQGTTPTLELYDPDGNSLIKQGQWITDSLSLTWQAPDARTYFLAAVDASATLPATYTLQLLVSPARRLYLPIVLRSE